ncbi:iron-containing alcohol dehydrogenase [Nonomuraea sp. NPDC059023]|uniref:3-dehydroquinate synthase family protein n=1 Tax=unclassified Nonomuraea TaxID=2593643 RepID=UPI0036C23162
MHVDEVTFGRNVVPYYSGFDCNAEISELLARELGGYGHVAMIIDSAVWSHAEKLIENIRHELRIVPVMVAASEQNKSLAAVERIVDQLIDQGVGRNSVVVAMGGGVLGNMAGLVAALLFRGLPLVHLPTTPVAAFDAVISEKQAVNLRRGKNLFGAYLIPSLIACDLAWLETVPDDQMLTGLAEMAKNVLAAVPHDAGDFLAAVVQRRESPDRALSTLLRIGVEAKTPLLAIDSRERNEAILFEYGHTVGHAVEFASGGAISHGEAVAWGMLAAADIARETHGLSDDAVRTHHRLIDVLAFGRDRLRAVRPEAVKELLITDNKRGYLPLGDDEVAMVLLESIGRPVRSGGRPLVAVPRSVVDRAIEALWSSETTRLSA